MTLQQLNEHYELVERYINAENLLQRLCDSAGLKAQAITGMPHGTGVSDKVGDTVVEIVRTQERLDVMRKQIREREKPILLWIDGIPDLCTQSIFRLRFIHGKTWKEVSGMVGGYSEDALKKMCYKELSR